MEGMCCLIPDITIPDETINTHKQPSETLIYFYLKDLLNGLTNKKTPYIGFYINSRFFLFSETIFGYKNLKIKYYVTCGSLNTFITVDYKDKLELAFLKVFLTIFYKIYSINYFASTILR